MPAAWRAEGAASGAPLAVVEAKLRARHAAAPVLPADRHRVCRVCNAITVLATAFVAMTPASIMHVYKAAEALAMEPAQMLTTASRSTLVAGLGSDTSD